MLHSLIRWLAKRGIRWFYRGVEFVGAENIPASGATLLVASHGNDLPDILLTFMASRRDVLFIANVTAADLPLVKWTYAGLGVIPIARTRDARGMKARGEDAAALNARAFVSVTEALGAGHMVAIFPEGNVHDLPHLAPMRTGAAKMALETVASGAVRTLALVPIGYQYERQMAPRSGVVAVIGAPVRVEEWHAEHPARAIPEFTRFIHDQLQRVTRNSATWEEAAELSELVAATGAAVSSAGTTPMAAAARVGSRVQHGAAPPEIVRLAAELTSAVAGFGGRRWSAADHATVLRAAGDDSVFDAHPAIFQLWALAPVAALGWLWHALPWWACHSLARRTSPRPVELAARTLVPGLYLMALWYVSLPVLLLAAGVSPWLALVLFVAQPRLGDFAFQWRDNLRTRQLMSRVGRASAARKDALVELANRLRQAWRTMEQAVAP